MSSETYKFLKMQATGNDFLIATGIPDKFRADVAKKFCDRNFGFGADGFIVIEKNKNEYAWDFYNSDGSRANLCGNAARAVALHLMEKDRVKEISFMTNAGKVTAKRLGKEEIEIRINLATGLTPKPLSVHSAVLIDAGVPHAVVKVESLKDLDALREIGLDIKDHFAGDGINVTFYAVKSKELIKSVTFERGVEEFTLSCGTGAIAAAKVFGAAQCKVQVPGGEVQVLFSGKDAILRGDAHFIGWCTPIIDGAKEE